jgi:hypothetical protein
VGGFNPRFTDVPPEAKGAVDRIGAAFKVGSFSLKLGGYFALTPGTIQAGFDITLAASLGPVGVKGQLGFDVIVYRDPQTHFADFRFSAAITCRLHARRCERDRNKGTGAHRGQAHVLDSWVGHLKSLDERWECFPQSSRNGRRRALAAEIKQNENWSTALPAASNAFVTLAPRQGDTIGRTPFSS